MIFIIILVVIIANILLGGAIMLGISRLFKLSSATYKRSLLINLAVVIVMVLAQALFGMFIVSFVAWVIAIFVGFFILHYFFKKYYLSSIKQSLGVFILSIIIGAVTATAIALPIRLFVAEPFVIAGSSMSPYLNDGDYLFVTKFDSLYQRNDVVVYITDKSPAYIVGRIVGLPSENILIRDEQLLVNGVASDSEYSSSSITGNVEVTLSSAEYYILGDNSSSSRDSRFFGPISRSQIVGKVTKQLLIPTRR